MVSTLTQEGANATFEALRKGAFDFVPKPLGKAGSTLQDFQQDVLNKVRAAAASMKSGLLTSSASASQLTVPPDTTVWLCCTLSGTTCDICEGSGKVNPAK